MYLVNHYLDVDILGIDIPDMTAASTTNGEASIMAQVNECDALYGRHPNFILVSRKIPATTSILLLNTDGARTARLGQHWRFPDRAELSEWGRVVVNTPLARNE